MKKKPVPALGYAEDLVSQLDVVEDDPRAMRIGSMPWTSDFVRAAGSVRVFFFTGRAAKGNSLNRGALLRARLPYP
jgi:hypothetical protein